MGYTLLSIILAVIIFSGIVIGVSNFYAEIGTNYNVNTTDFRFLDKSRQIQSTLNQTQTRIAQPNNIVEIGAFIAFSALDTLKLSFQTIGVLQSIVTDASSVDALTTSDIQIPAWATTMILGIIIAIFVIIFLSTWTRWKLD